MRESNDGGPFNMVGRFLFALCCTLCVSPHVFCLIGKWDRTAFVTPEYCQWGSASVAKHEDVIEHNFFLMGPYFGVSTPRLAQLRCLLAHNKWLHSTQGNYGLDFDDGTRNMTTRNLLGSAGIACSAEILVLA